MMHSVIPSSYYKRGVLLLVIAAIVVVIILFFTFSSTERPVSTQTSDPIFSVSTVESPLMKLPIIISPVSSLTINSVLTSPVLLPAQKMFSVLSKYETAVEFYESGDYHTAIDIFSEILTEAGPDPSVYDARGTAYTAVNDYENALDDYSKAIDLDMSFAQAYYNRGRVYIFLDINEQAFLDLQKSAELSPDEFSYRANGNIGLIYHQMGEYNKALEAFEESISYNEDEKADIYYFRGETYSAMGNYEAAIADYQAAIERFSNYNQAYQGLGYAYFKTDRLNEAVEALNQALQISPNNPVSHLYFTLVYLALEESDQAQAQAIQAARSIDQLPQEEQSRILVSVLADLETFRENHPNRAEEVDTIITLLPAP